MHHSILKLIIACSLLLATHAANMCPLCGSPYVMPKRWDFPVSSTPYKTCRDIFFQLGSLSITHPQCSPQQDKYQDVCCNAEIPPGWDVPPTAAPVSETGTQPVCRICKTDEFPGLPNVFISARYVGDYSCAALYHRGRNKLIPGFMCGPLQDYAYDKCGCGEHNPNLNTQPPNPNPTPQPTPNPTPNPTPDPTPGPTPDPTPNPTPRPTPYPTPPPTSPNGLTMRKSPPTGDKNDLRLYRESKYKGRRGLRSRQLPNDTSKIAPVEA